jgi:hypothetical protein
MRTLSAGAARRDITPPAGTWLTGFIARLAPCAGAAEPIHARALVLASDGKAAAVVQVDLLGMTPWQVTEIREFAAARLGIPWERCTISCTHTHAGPAIMLVRGCGMAGYEYQRFMVSQVQQALEEAAAAARPASMALASAPYRLGVNRREEGPHGVTLGVAPEKPRPGTLSVARVKTDTQEIRLFTHACHPYVLGGDNLLASGDFPSFACNDLERTPREIAVFLNGCAGNIAPESAFKGLDAARKEGLRMADAVRSLESALVPTDGEWGLEGRRRVVPLPYRALPTEAQVDAILEKQEETVRESERSQPAVQARVRAATADWAAQMKRVLRLEVPLEPVHCEVQRLTLPGLILVGISGEPFYEIGERIRTGLSSSAAVWPLGYTNAYCGYLPTRAETHLGGYEVNDAWRFLGMWQIDDTAEDRVVNAALEIAPTTT